MKQERTKVSRRSEEERKLLKVFNQEFIESRTVSKLWPVAVVQLVGQSTTVPKFKGLSPGVVYTSGLYYKPMTIINEDSRVINNLEASLTDDARVIIYDHHMFIVQAVIYKSSR